MASIEILRYRSLASFDNLRHFTSTRMGGVSSGNYASLNLGLYSGDDEENIAANFSLFCKKINIPREQIHLPYQTHESNVLNVDEAFTTLSADKQKDLLHGMDALITNVPGQCVAVTTADCVPILMFDPVRKAVAAAHAGWRGTCSRIAKHTVEAMQKHFGTKPQDLYAVIGASISRDVYNVGEELVAAFEAERFETEKIFTRRNGAIYLDLWSANKAILAEAGVQDHRVEIAGYCTFTEQDMFFSARRLGIKSGRIISGVMVL